MPVADRNTAPSATQIPTDVCQLNTRRYPVSLREGRTKSFFVRAVRMRITHRIPPATTTMPSHDAASSL